MDMRLTNKRTHFAGTAILLAVAAIVFEGCISLKKYRIQAISVKSNPDASIFWADGAKAQTKRNYTLLIRGQAVKNRWSTDANGNGVIYVSKHGYKAEKGKIIIAKAGYEPQEFKLKWNLKKTQTFILSNSAKYHAHDYYALAHEATSDKKRVELLRAAMFHDPENDEGVGLLAANELAKWEYWDKNYTEAMAYVQTALKMNPTDSTVQANIQAINQVFLAKAEKRRQRIERMQRYNENAQAWLQWGRATSAQLSNQPTSGGATTSNYISGANKVKKGTSVAGALSSQREHRAYNDAVSQLSRMKTGLDPYDDAMRRRIQGQMRSMRKSDKSIKKDPLEDWDGTK